MTERLLAGRLPWGEIISQRRAGLGGTVLDIGANIGITSLLRIVGGDAQRVYAVEPEPQNYRNLVAAVVANGLEGIILPDCLAISDETATGTLRVATRMGNHVLAPGPMAGGVDVETMTLDAWVDRRAIDADAVSLVKLDTQGAEGRILRGADRLLGHRHITWVLEFSPRHLEAAGTPVRDLFALLQAHFTHAIDLDGAEPHPFHTSALAGRLHDVGRGGRRYTNLLLFSGD